MKQKIIPTILIIGAMLGSYVAGLTYENNRLTTQYKEQLATKVDYRIPSELMDAARAIGLTNQQLIDVNAQIGADPGGCPRVYAQSCWDPQTDTVRVYAVAFQDGTQDESLAYEYYHHVWEKLLTDGRRAQLTPEVHAVYDKLAPVRPALRTEVSTLTANEGSLDSPAITDELNSISCTKVRDSELTPNLLAYCNQFVPGRASIEKPY